MAPDVPQVMFGPVAVMAMSEVQVVDHVAASWRAGVGGSIATVNVDILRAASRNPAHARLVRRAALVVADGMPVVWAARLAGTPVPERVTGASLTSTLAAAAAGAGRSVFLIGGEPGIPDAAGRALLARFPGLRVVGVDSPPFGFERSELYVAALVRRVAAAQPDLVLVGMGFPKQEDLIELLRPAVPGAWLLGCGAGIPFLAGQFRRAPAVVQRIGAEWLFRLLLEPRRLAGRYLNDDLPFALGLLARAALSRLRRPVPVAPATDVPVQVALPTARPAPDADFPVVAAAALGLPLPPVPTPRGTPAPTLVLVHDADPGDPAVPDSTTVVSFPAAPAEVRLEA